MIFYEEEDLKIKLGNKFNEFIHCKEYLRCKQHSKLYFKILDEINKYDDGEGFNCSKKLWRKYRKQEKLRLKYEFKAEQVINKYIT